MMSDDTFLKSSFYEQLVEHVFISEILQEVWFSFQKTVEVLRSEVDASGYDLVFECEGVMRHIQLKTSKVNAKTASQKVHVALAEKPSGCVVWMVRQEDSDKGRMKLTYLLFAGEPRQRLPSLDNFKVAKHTKANVRGIKSERPALRVVPKSRFTPVPTTKELVARLFGISN